MKAGKLRNRVLIERPVITQDSLGAPKKSWAQVATVQAQVGYVSGREFFGSDRADLAEVTTRIYLREIPGEKIDPSMRVTDVDSGAVYDLVAVLPSDRREMLTLAAKSGSRSP